MRKKYEEGESVYLWLTSDIAVVEEIQRQQREYYVANNTSYSSFVQLHT